VDVEAVLAGGDLLAPDEDVAFGCQGRDLVLAGPPDPILGELLEELVHAASLQGGTAVVDHDLLSADGSAGGAARVGLLGVGGDRAEGDGRGQGSNSLHHHHRDSFSGLDAVAGRGADRKLHLPELRTKARGRSSAGR
jgi:hypothetical protein